MKILNEFIVVDEKAFYNLSCDRTSQDNYNTIFHCLSKFGTLVFNVNNFTQTLTIEDIGNVSEPEKVPLAQIIRWRWNEKGQQVIRETEILKIGESLEFDISSYSASSFVVRILKKREKTDQNPCPSLNSPEDDLTVQIGEEKITVSAHWLMNVSPVIRRMLSVEMKEKQQRLINLNGLDVDMDNFKEFLGYISPIALHEQILPTPKNVLILLKLADYFQVNWLKLNCDFHLVNCVEIPLIDRFLLIEKYGLSNLKDYFLLLDVNELGAFFKTNRQQFLASVPVSFKFYANLFTRLSG